VRRILTLDRHTAPHEHFVLVAWPLPLSSANREPRACPSRIAIPAAQSAVSDTGNRPKRSVGTSRGGAFWLVAIFAVGTCFSPSAHGSSIHGIHAGADGGARAALRATRTAANAAAAQTDAQAVKPVPPELPAVVARVNGEDIPRAEFEDAVQSIEARAGGPVPPQERDLVLRGLLDQMIGFKLLIQETRSRNVMIPDADVEARIDQIRGQFPSEQVFQQALQQQQLTLEQLRADARQEMAVTKMIQDEIAGKVAVSDEQVTTFYRENPDQFQQDARVRASHILIAFPQDADDAAKSEARATAEGVLKEVKDGKDFEGLAREHSQDPGSAANGGDLGYFQEGEMVGPFNDAAFSLPVGATSDLVETRFGYHIIRVADKQPARTIPLEEVRPQVEEYLEELNRQEQTEAFVNALKTKGKVEVFM
jgi:peptidyl-prolyl cis-trans isomerase C